MSKVGIIGATGRIGQYAALAISRSPYVREIALYGRKGNECLLDGIKRDMRDSFAATGNYTHIAVTTELSDLRGSDIIVFTAGLPRRADQDRSELAYENARVVAGYISDLETIVPDAIILMVTNPVDVMTAVAIRYFKNRIHQVFGLGTHLDSMRLKSIIASRLKVHVSEVHTRIIGEHGDSMVPLWSATTIGGIQIQNLPAFGNLPIDDIMATVRNSGQQIIAGKGATVWGPGDAIATLVSTVLGDENRILTVSAYLSTEMHSIGDLCIGVPARITRKGVFPVSIKIDKEEEQALIASAKKIKDLSLEVFASLENEGITP